MDQQFTKKKKKTNRKKPDNDPIIKKKQKLEKPKTAKKEPEIDFEEHVEEQEEEKLNFEKFMDMFQENKNSKVKAKKNSKEIQARNRIMTKDIGIAQYPRIETIESEKDPLEEHFGLDYNDLVKNKLNLLEEKAPENIADKYLSKKDFVYSFEEAEDIEVLNTHQDAVTNQVKLKEYELKHTLKGSGKVYQDQIGEVWTTDAKVEAITKGSTEVISKPVMHSVLQINADMEASEENNVLQTVFPIMESYYDLIFSDPNEENCFKVRKN